jgi:serine-protein kinase ATM
VLIGDSRLKLDDKSYHRLFDAIFRCTLAEKEAYYQVKGSKAKTNAFSRLTKCAEALRLSVEHAATKIKRRTFLAVIDHITDILPHPEDGLVPPLASDYIKALAALLSRGANVEVLATQNSDGWFTCVDFVTRIISQHIENADRDSGPSRASPAPATGVSMTLPLSTTRSGSAPRRSNERVPRGHLADLMECLSFLVSAPNAPLLQRAREIADAALHVLQLRYLGLSQLQQLAFSVINAVLVVTQTDNTAQASSMAIECLPLIMHWWQARTASKYDALLNVVRVEMLKALYNVYLQLEYLTRQDDPEALLGDMQSLSEMLWSEYSKRDDRAQLQQDDLTYIPNQSAVNQFCIPSFALRPFNVEGERQWAVVQILGMLEGIMWRRSRATHLDPAEDNVSEQPRKKQRKDAGFSRLCHKLQSLDHTTQFTALQMIPFFVVHVDIPADELYDLLSILTGLVTNKNSKLSTWAMIACARSVTQPFKHVF